MSAGETLLLIVLLVSILGAPAYTLFSVLKPLTIPFLRSPRLWAVIALFVSSYLIF